MKRKIEEEKKISILLNLGQLRPTSKKQSGSFRPQEESAQSRRLSRRSGSVDSSFAKYTDRHKMGVNQRLIGNQQVISKFNPKGSVLNASTSVYSSSDKAAQNDYSQESKLKSTLETDYENLKVSKVALESEEKSQVIIQDLKLDGARANEGILKKRSSQIMTLPAKQNDKPHFSHFMKVLFNEKTESSEQLVEPPQNGRQNEVQKPRPRIIARSRMSRIHTKSVTEVLMSNRQTEKFPSPNTNQQSGQSGFDYSRLQSKSTEHKPPPNQIHPHARFETPEQAKNLKPITRQKRPHHQEETADLKASLDSVAPQVEPRPLVPVWKNRRFCITDTLMLQSVKKLKKPLEVLAARFKSTIFDCEKEIFDNPKYNDQRQLSQFSSCTFIMAGKFNKGQFTKNIQACLESLLHILKQAGSYKPQSRPGSHSTGSDVLKGDPVLTCIRGIFNCESILILIDIYFKITFHSLDLEKSEALAKVMLSLSYLHESFLYKFEAYFMLGRVMERKRETEKALFCYTRAMQLCWEEGDMERDGLACDKIGTRK